MVRRVGWFGLVALLVTVASIVACRQTIGIDQYFNAPADAGAVTSACGLPYGTNACASCAATSCCTESSACATSPVCAPYESCLGKCNGDPQCRSQCALDNPVGTSAEVSVLSACLASKCETACGLTCGAIADTQSPPAAAAACQSCMTTNACGPARACGSSVDCDAYTRCLLACSTLDCREACAKSHDAGAALFAPIQQGVAGSCSTQCAFGRSWSCVGHVSWPLARSQTVEMTALVATGPTVTPVGAGVNVTVSDFCPPATAGARIFAQGQTDATGTVIMQVPQGSRLPGGLNGCITVTSPSFLPTFWYWGFPLTEPTVVWTYPSSVDTRLSTVIVPVSPASLTTIYGLGGVAPDPTRSTVGVVVYDCMGALAPGVKITTDADAGVGALYGAAFSATATATDATGLMILLNVPTGTGELTLTATPIALGKPSSSVTISVQPNSYTEALMYPTP